MRRLRRSDDRPTRASRLATVALAAVTLLPLLPAAGHAQTPAALEPAALGFLGFRPGDSLSVLGARVAALGGRPLRCQRSRTDHRVQECRATVVAPEGGVPIELWASAIDGVAGVITLSGRLAGAQLDQWRESLETSYGRAGARVQGPQWSMQWVRRGRMLRLTWRVEKGDKVASVSLVDGRTLDDWGRSRRGAGGG